MAEIVLFHHVQGLTAGVLAFAHELRAAKHTVHTPDLFEGRTFPTLDEGMDYARTVGFGAILERGVADAEALGSDLVYAGFSMGVMPAQKLAQTRAGARAALLIDACVPVHRVRRRDGPTPFRCRCMAWTMTSSSPRRGTWKREPLSRRRDQAELYLYPGNVHLFADSSLPSHDTSATELMTRRVLAFLTKLD